MTPRFDRDRAYGTVLPSNHFYQDGHYFDAQGEYLRSDEGFEPAPAETKAPTPEPRQEKEPDPKPETSPKSETPAPAATKGSDADDVDLAAWAKGEAKIVHFKVVQAMQATYPDVEFGRSRAAIVAFLIEKGVVSKDEAVV